MVADRLERDLTCDLERPLERGCADRARARVEPVALADFFAEDFARLARPPVVADLRAALAAGFRPGLLRRAPDFEVERFREEFISLQYAPRGRSSLPRRVETAVR